MATVEQVVSVGKVIYKEGHNWQATNDSRENTTKITCQIS